MARESAPNALLLAIATLISVILIVAPLSIKESIASKLGPIFFFPASKATASLEGIATLSRENQRLRLELASNLVDRARLYDMDEQNSRFRQMLEIRETLSFQLLPGMVIARPGHFTGEYIAVDVGAEQGAIPGLGVISIRGLVGRVVEVRESSCLVRSLLSPQSRVSIVVARTGAGGILKANGTKGLIVPDIPLEEEVTPGDTVLTSGLGGVYPPGLKVGIVVSVGDDMRLLVHKAKVRPLERFSKVREVFLTQVPQVEMTPWKTEGPLEP